MHVSYKVLRIGLFIWINHNYVAVLGVTFHTVVPNFWTFNKRGFFQCSIRLFNNSIADNHACHKHLFFSIGKYWSIIIRVRTFECEIACLSPHSIVCKYNIEAFFAFINSLWRSLSSSMIQFAHICNTFILHRNIFNLIFEYFPQLTILNSLNF